MDKNTGVAGEIAKHFEHEIKVAADAMVLDSFLGKQRMVEQDVRAADLSRSNVRLSMEADANWYRAYCEWGNEAANEALRPVLDHVVSQYAALLPLTR